MRVARLTGHGQLTVIDVAKPDPSRGEVLVRVHGCAICGSDLHLFRGHDPWRSPSAGPRSLGHETAGTVEAVGIDVTRIMPGDRVAIEPGFLRACRRCPWCMKGRSELCQDRGEWQGRKLGVGGFADFELAPQSNVHPVPAGVGLDVAALADVYACAVHAVRLARRTAGGPAAVVGTGGVAMALGQVAKADGFSPVTMIGSRSRALSRALEAGAADHVLSSADGHPAPAAEPPRDPPGVVFDCAGGNGSSMQRALSVIAPGGLICVLGAFWDDVPIGYDMANSKEVSVQFSNAYSQTGADPEFPAALRLMMERKVDPQPLITHRFSLDRINEAFVTAADKSSSEAIRILVQP